MLKNKHSFKYFLLLCIVCAGIFVINFKPVTVNDAYFGIKLGELVVTTKHVPTQEPFSWSAHGRTVVTYEWLFQVILYALWLIGGFSAIQFFVCAVSTGIFLVFYSIVRHGFGRDKLFSLALSIFAVSTIYEFLVARPHIFGMLFLLVILFCIYRSKTKSNILWVTLPIMYLWTNSHASFILGPLLLCAHAILFYYAGKITHEEKHIDVSKRLAIASLLTFFVTLAPPLFGQSYQLLYHFWVNRDIVTKFIVEWGPITQDIHYFWMYTILYATTLMCTLWFFVKNRLKKQTLLTIPLLIIATFAFTSIRNVGLGSIALALLLGITMPLPASNVRSKLFSVVVCMFLLVLSLVLTIQKVHITIQEQQSLNTKSLATEMNFLKGNQLKGHMFNEFAFGSYLLYFLHPTYQIFFDGRADVYFCCEMRDVMKVLEAKGKSDEEFRNAFTTFLQTYQFSYLIIPIQSHNPQEFTAVSRMADMLLDDPAWSLVFIGDSMEILVKNDAQNDEIIQTFGTGAITPLRINQFRSGQEKLALEEYTRLISIAPSATAWNGVGVAQVALGNSQDAKRAFQMAIERNPLNGKPYLGLGKLAMSEKQYTQAEVYLRNAITQFPFLGEAYIVLGQLYKDQGNENEAKIIWNNALAEDIDLLSRQKIVQKMNSLQ